MKYVNSTKLDERIIRTDLDPGFREGRQFGRGKSGGQVRDEYRPDYDAGRGGWGHLQRIKIEREREMAVKANYEASDVPTGAEEYKSRVNNAGMLIPNSSILKAGTISLHSTLEDLTLECINRKSQAC